MPNRLHYPASSNKHLAPSTRFKGSKRKLLPWLESVFSQLNFDHALDLMSGTGSVSYLLKRMGKKVTANDYLRFNYFTANAFIENSRYTISELELEWFLGNHSNVNYKTFVQDNFEDFYFTKSENRLIDRIICNIHSFTTPKPSESSAKRALAIHALIQACLMKRPFNLFHRRNLYLRQADVSRNFGNLTTWETPLDVLFRRHVIESNFYVFDNRHRNRAINKDAGKLTSPPVDLVYIDPPYFRSDG
ncbi:MAG: DNA adenine methylase, partial [Gammaproteobacteria bacterium]|nr:DNA adenine methylase [Gammaproteobacteria bacterium]